jgi:hypothetical protein
MRTRGSNVRNVTVNPHFGKAISFEHYEHPWHRLGPPTRVLVEGVTPTPAAMSLTQWVATDADFEERPRDDMGARWLSLSLDERGQNTDNPPPSAEKCQAPP